MSLELWVNFCFFRVFCGSFLWTTVVITVCILCFSPPLPGFRSVLPDSVHVPLCAAPSVGGRGGRAVPGALRAVPAGARGEPTVPAGLPGPGAAHVPAALRRPPHLPARAALPAHGGRGARQPRAHRHPTGRRAPLRARVQGQIPADRGLLPRGSASWPDQTFLPQGMASALCFCVVVLRGDL